MSGEHAVTTAWVDVLVPGPGTSPAVLLAYLIAALVASLLLVALLVKVGRVCYRYTKPVLTYLDRRLPLPVPTGGPTRVLATVLLLLLAGSAGFAALDAAGPYIWYGEPLPTLGAPADASAEPVGFEGDARLLGTAAVGNDSLPDADGDGLPDAWERAGETPDGVALPDADPHHKDLYVQVNHGVTGRELTAEERAELERVWASMPVENPDGERGVRLHLDTDPPGGAELGVLAQVTGPDEAGRFYTREHLGDRLCRYHQVTLGQVAGNATAVSDAPGHAVVVDTGRREDPGDTPWRVYAVTHGLLHNVAGPLDEQGDGAVHTDAGWLATEPGADDDHLPVAVADRLSERGFAQPANGTCGTGGTEDTVGTETRDGTEER